MRRLAYFYFALFFSAAAFGQDPEALPKFEVADVHLSAPSQYPFMRGPYIRAGRYELRNGNMVDLVRTAYGVDADKVVGGPAWLEMDRFDVIAKAPAGSTPETLRMMLQSLLVDRFKLMIRNDNRPMPAYSLVAGKRPQLKQADGSGETGCKFQVEGMPGRGGNTSGPPPPPPPEGGGAVIPSIVYTCRNMTMTTFAEGMRGMPMLAQYLEGRPVVDSTELRGSWDFNFKYSVRIGPVAAGAEMITIFAAMEKQLGLKLDAAKISMAVIEVASVNQKPTANVPDAAESLQIQSPTEFEVADVKPTDPDVKGMNFQIQPGGRMNLRGVTLKLLIQQAWSISDEMIVGAPKWLDTNRFDIIAKAPTVTLATPPRPGGPSAQMPPVDIDALWLMLRGLLADRFKLKVHREDQPVTAYTLVAGKTKLKKADPSSRTGWKEGPPPDGKDPRTANPALGRLVTCQNMTMKQFAGLLQSIAPGYISSPVLDNTGIEGAWDFTLSFSPAGIVRSGGGGGRGGDAGPAPAAAPAGSPVASDPTGGLSLFDAIDKQLGLKLEKQKRPVSVLVIDHIEEKPTDN